MKNPPQILKQGGDDIATNTLKKALRERQNILLDRLSNLYDKIPNDDPEKSENIMDLLIHTKDELNSIREIIKICEERGRY